MLDGKAYYHAVRGHQLTYEALWQIRWPLFESWLAENEHQNCVEVKELAQNVSKLFKERRGDNFRVDLQTAVNQLTDVLSSEKIQDFMEKFEKAHSSNPNFKLWSTYMEMVEVLLNFIRAERDGNWALHLESFAAMLPWLTIYDHTNYARWGPVYLADMKNLEKTAPEVHAYFTDGNFVVKRSKRYFNQVPADQATEWINKSCKIQNGVIGITRNDQARNKFCITWSERSRISQDTRCLFNLEDDAEDSTFIRSDSIPSRTKRDTDDVNKLVKQLQSFDVFRVNTAGGDENVDPNSRIIPLVSLATKDIAPNDVVTYLLTAQDCGKQHLVSNVKQ